MHEQDKVLYEARLIAGEGPNGNINLSDFTVERSSSLQKLLRTTAWVLRCVDRYKKRDDVTGSLTPQELKKAKLLWDRFIQDKYFNDMIKLMKENKRDNLARQLNLTIDKQGF